MKLNKFIYIITFIAIATSCTKMIDLYPESNLNTGTFYRNLQEIDVALTGCYKGMQNTLTEEWQVTELRSDNSIQGVPASQAVPNRDLSDLDMFMLNTSHQGNFLYWSNIYNNLRNINLLLNALNVNYSPSTKTIAYDNLTISISDADRKARAAEAQFIRAYHYFNLVRLYGGVFLIHEPVTPEQAKLTNRSTVADIYALIEADLNSAIASGIAEKFTAGSPNLGRANSWAAKALLAKVYLTQNKKTEAITLLQDVIANSGYGLQPNYLSVLSIANEMSNEVPLQTGSAVINGDGRGLNYPSTDVLNSYFNIPITNAIITAGSNILTLPAPNPDIRVGMYVSATQVPATATITAINGVTVTMSATATATSATANVVIGDPRRTASIATYNPGAKHYPVKLISNPTVANDAENDWIVLRYADVLLMLAEAQGNSTASIALINQVRTRARLAPLNAADINTTALFEAALARERRNEFAFENQRWFDLLRYTVTFSTINAVQAIKDHFTIEYPTHYNGYPAPRLSLLELQNNVTAQKLLLPIPQREIDNNSTIVIPQNPGY
ncbi:MAG: RagB/SusD family nutrient uptake outer membrane protein [Chitinophagaceae bacterium]|nr:RagB/SusD family nutrient uptake outer membrane protein [Chitinophagaceae bacterium]